MSTSDFADSIEQKLWDLHCMHRDSYIRSINFHRKMSAVTGKDCSDKINKMLGYIAEIDAKYPGKFDPVV